MAAFQKQPQGLQDMDQRLEQTMYKQHKSKWGPFLYSASMNADDFELREGSYGPEPADGTFLVIRILDKENCLKILQKISQ